MLTKFFRLILLKSTYVILFKVSLGSKIVWQMHFLDVFEEKQEANGKEETKSALHLQQTYLEGRIPVICGINLCRVRNEKPCTVGRILIQFNSQISDSSLLLKCIDQRTT